jgi:hypothetical protein
MAIEHDIPIERRLNGLSVANMQHNRPGVRHVLGNPDSCQRDLVLRIARRPQQLVLPGFNAIRRRGLAILSCPAIWSEMEVTAFTFRYLRGVHYFFFFPYWALCRAISQDLSIDHPSSRWCSDKARSHGVTIATSRLASFVQGYFFSNIAVQHNVKFVVMATADRMEHKVLGLSLRFALDGVTRIERGLHGNL